MTSKIKICGIRRVEDINYVNGLLPEYIGFVFAKSKRQVTIEDAAKLKKLLSPNIKAVGVFVNEEIAKIKEICDKNIIDIIQLHGDEDENYIASLKLNVDLPIIISLTSSNPAFMEKTKKIKKVFNECELLFDAPVPGSGKTFNWNSLINIKHDYFLAGGITPENVAEAIELLHPYCIDVSSGVENLEGFKDFSKIKKLINTIRSYK